MFTYRRGELGPTPGCCRADLAVDPSRQIFRLDNSYGFCREKPATWPRLSTDSLVSVVVFNWITRQNRGLCRVVIRLAAESVGVVRQIC